MAVFTGYNFYIMKNFSLIVVGILFIYCVSSCRKQVDKGFVWRANLCATFLGNLVYPTPASKMLHFP